MPFLPSAASEDGRAADLGVFWVIEPITPIVIAENCAAEASALISRDATSTTEVAWEPSVGLSNNP